MQTQGIRKQQRVHSAYATKVQGGNGLDEASIKGYGARTQHAYTERNSANHHQN